MTIFITSGYLVESLTHYLDQGMLWIWIRWWLQVFQAVSHGVNDGEGLIYLSHEEKADVGGDLGALKIDHNGPVKIRADFPWLSCITIEHL